MLKISTDCSWIDHRMKILIGNSMTVNVIEEILKKGLKSLEIL